MSLSHREKIIPSFKTIGEAFDFITLVQKKTEELQLYDIKIESTDIDNIIEKYNLVKQNSKKIGLIQSKGWIDVSDKKQIEVLLSKFEQVLLEIKEINELVLILHIFANRKSRRDDDTQIETDFNLNEQCLSINQDSKNPFQISFGFVLNELYKPTIDIELSISNNSQLDKNSVIKYSYNFFSDCFNALKIESEIIPIDEKGGLFAIIPDKSKLKIMGEGYDRYGLNSTRIEYSDWKIPFEMLKYGFNNYLKDSLKQSFYNAGGSSKTIKQVKEILDIDDSVMWYFHGRDFFETDFLFLKNLLNGKDNITIRWDSVFHFQGFTPTGIDIKLINDNDGYTFFISSEDINLSDEEFKSMIEKEFKVKLEFDSYD